MALVRYTEFYDLLDRLIRVEIHDTTFAGVASEFKTFKPGAVIASSKFNQTPTDLIKGTSCTIFFKVEDGTDKTFITGIVGAHEEQYVCVVYIDSVFEFAGYILTDLCSIEAGTYPYVAELTATEGLSRLTDVDMLDSGSLYTGKLTVLEAFIECLSKIGTQTYWPVSASDDWIHTSVDWWEANHPSRANNIDPLAYTRFDATVFLETRQTDDGQIQVQLGDDGLPKPRKVSDVLFDLCRCWDVRLYLARGTWHIEQVNLLDETDIPYRAYDTTGSLSGSGTFKPRKTVDCDIIKPLTDGEYTFHAPVLKVTARRAHQSNYNLLSTRTLPFDTDLDETVIGTLATGANNTVSVSGRMWLRWAGVAGTVLFYTGVKVTIRLTDGVDDYYLDGSDWNSQNVYTAGNRRNYTAASWQQYATSYYCWYPGMKGSANGFLYVPIDIITPDLPISGQVSVEIDFIIEKDRYLYTSGYDIPGNYIYRLENLTCIYNEGTAANYTAIEILNTTDGTTPVTDTRSIDLGDIRFGDGVNAVSLGAFEVSQDALTWVASALWHEGTSGENYAMLELLCREVLARQRLASRIFTSTIHGGQICHEDVLTYDNLVWMSAAVNVDLHDDMARGEWVAIGKDRQYIKDNFTTNLIAPRLDVVPAVDYSDTKTRNASFTYAGVATRGGSQLTASYDAGDTLTALAVADLGFDLGMGAKIHVVNPYTGEYQTFTTDDDYVSGGTEIPVDTTAAIDLPVGSFVVVDVSAVMANAGSPELWTRTGTVLSPTTAGDVVEVVELGSQIAISGASSNNIGVYGGSSSNTLPAVYGWNVQPFTPAGAGVMGNSTNGYGVHGMSTNSYGVYAISTAEHAVYATASAATKAAVYATGATYGVQALSSANGSSAVYATHLGGNATGSAVQGVGINGVGVYGSSNGTVAGKFWRSSNPANSVLPVLELFRGPYTGYSEAGIGGRIDMQIPNGAGAQKSFAALDWYVVDPTASSEDGALLFNTMRAGTLTPAVRFLNTGAVKFDTYGDGTFTGTPTYAAVFDADGNVIEVDYEEGVGLWKLDSGKIVQRTAFTPVQVVVDSGYALAVYNIDSGDGVLGVAENIANYGIRGNCARFGEIGQSDYAEFDRYGVLRLFGAATVFDDQQVELGAVRLGSSAPTWTAYKGSEILSFAKNLDNKIFFRCQLTHRYKTDSTIHFHVHYTVPDNNTGDVRWVLTYSWANIGEKFPAQSTEPGVITVPANSQDTHLVEEIYSPVPGTTGGGFSSYLLCSLMREGTHDEDTYDAAAYLLGIDFHVECDKLGTTDEYDDNEGTTTTTTA